MTFSSAVVTPNGDGINDVLRIDYTLYGLPQSVPVNIELYALDGKRMALVNQGLQGSGPQEVEWDGRDERGRPAAGNVFARSGHCGREQE